MQLQSILLLTGLAASAAADSISFQKHCSWEGTSYYCSNSAIWYTNTSHFDVNAGDGCRNPGVPYVTQACWDWDKKRGHFLAQGQPKRCFKISHYSGVYSCGTQTTCEDWVWSGTTCTWRVANDATTKGDTKGDVKTARAALPEPEPVPVPEAEPVPVSEPGPVAEPVTKPVAFKA